MRVGPHCGAIAVLEGPVALCLLVMGMKEGGGERTSQASVP